MKQEEEIRELKHEPEPGYRVAFYFFFAVAALYLAFILLKAFS
jgi:hypothetical protein